MAKLIMTLDGAIIREFTIDKDSISIGRKHGNDIQLNDLTVSGRHALITAVGDNTYVDDLGSTNGTLLNGGRVSKSLLTHGDVVQIGNYQFTFFQNEEEEYEPTMFLRAEIEDTQIMETNPPKPSDAKGAPLAAVKILNGPLKSKVLELRKPFNTLGFNGIKMAMIARTNDGYTLSAIKNTKLRRSNDTPSINGELLTEEVRPLKPHDVLELADTQMEFFYVS
jgi:pSer/pThr/pTyr-binding forkhead associated (FHA) protein